MMRIDCHCHTIVSFDGLTKPPRFIQDAIRAKLDAVIVCDHNSLAGVEQIRRLNPPFRVIPGMEVNTADGELLALFVEQEVPSGRPVLETIDLIHQQDALAAIPHPFAVTALHRLKTPVLEQAAALVDAIEGINARNENPGADEKARELAARYGKPLTAGSDAHLPGHLGGAYLEMEDFTDAADFLAKLPAARPVLRKRSNVWINIFGLFPAIASLISKRLLPAKTGSD